MRGLVYMQEGKGTDKVERLRRGVIRWLWDARARAPHACDAKWKQILCCGCSARARLGEYTAALNIMRWMRCSLLDVVVLFYVYIYM